MRRMGRRVSKEEQELTRQASQKGRLGRRTAPAKAGLWQMPDTATCCPRQD